MQPITVCQIDLFAEELPSVNEIKKLSGFVHSSEINRLAFGEKVQENIGRTSPKMRLRVGIGLYLLGRDAEAAEKLKKGEDCKEKFLYLGFALRGISGYDKAIESFEKSLDYKADTLSVTLEKAATYRHASNFEAAGGELESCANFENVSAEYHYQLGRLEETQGLYEQAMDNYKTALEVSPGHQKALFRLAYRCDLSGDEDAAIDYYRQIASSAPVYVNALMNLAVLYEDMGEFDEASEYVEKILRYHPNHPRAILFEKDIESSKTMFYDEDKQKTKDRRTQILETPLSDFELSVRSRNCFRSMGIKTLGDLMKITEADLLAYKNFGETSLREIKAVLESKGLRLSMGLEKEQLSLAEDSEYDSEESQDEGLVNRPVDDLRLSVRARKCLQKLELRSLNDLTSKTEAELLGCKNFGVTSLNEIKEALTNLGLSLRALE